MSELRSRREQRVIDFFDDSLKAKVKGATS